MKLINKREYNQFRRIYGPKIYGYLFSILLIAIIGIIFQSCCCKLEKENEKKFIKGEEKASTDVQIIEKISKNIEEERYLLKEDQ